MALISRPLFGTLDLEQGGMFFVLHLLYPLGKPRPIRTSDVVYGICRGLPSAVVSWAFGFYGLIRRINKQGVLKTALVMFLINEITNAKTEQLFSCFSYLIIITL